MSEASGIIAIIAGWHGLLTLVARFANKSPDTDKTSPTRTIEAATVFVMCACLLLSQIESPLQLAIPLNFLFGPLLYFILADEKPMPGKVRLLVHALPAMCAVVYLGMIDALYSLNFKQGPITALQLVHCTLYIAFALHWRRQHSQSLFPKRMIPRMFLLIASIALGSVVLPEKFLATESLRLILGATLVCVACFCMHSMSFRQSQRVSDAASKPPQPPLRYKRSGLTDQEIDSFSIQIQEIMDNEKPFLSGNFSAKELAKRIGASPAHLSQILNQGLQLSFYQLTARHRIEEAKRHLRQGKLVSMEDLAYAVGYNSPSTFYKAFQKLENCTPGQFVKCCTESK